MLTAGMHACSRGERDYRPLVGLFSVRPMDSPPPVFPVTWCCFDHVQSPVSRCMSVKACCHYLLLALPAFVATYRCSWPLQVLLIAVAAKC